MHGLKYPREWEPVNQNTERMKVPGGWLVHTYTRTIVADKVFCNSESLIFMTDREGIWFLEKE